LATPDNIASLVVKLKNADPDENTTVILELFGNSTFRYRQFDGTMALPFKASNGYHMEGDIGVSDDDAFVKLVNTTGELFETTARCVKIIVPPLPRYLYTPCCNNRKHSTNFKEEGYELNMLHATTHFRPLLKETVTKMGAERFFVLDGVGGLLGVPAGENRGAASEILRELKNSCGTDGVHFTEVGYANLTRTIISAFAGIRAGTLTKSAVGKQGISGHHGSFFWRGFVSPVGHAGMSTDRPQSREQPGGEASTTMATGHTGMAVVRGPAVDPVAGATCPPSTTSLQASAGEAAEAILAPTIIPTTAKSVADTQEKTNPHPVFFFFLHL
jgi:hypothetical protein